MKSLERLAALGFAPTAILDVGAHAGDFARTARRIFPAAHILMVEALPECAPTLAKVCSEIGNAEFFVALVGAHPWAKVSFFVADNEAAGKALCKTGSSVYRERSDFPMEERKIAQTTLHAVRAGHTFGLVKLDIQGAELDALDGYGDMSAVDAILMEMSLVEYNEGAPLIADVLPAMRDCGFVLFDVDEHMSRDQRGTLLQIDGLFLRADARVRPKGPFWT